jgi:hypothetical protein
MALLSPRHAPGAILLLLLAAASSALAQERAPAPAGATSRVPRALTGKERTGAKWMDEQRVDDCKVPIEKRGSRPRPATCSGSNGE